MNSGDDRSVNIGGSVAGSVIQTGDGNSASVSYETLPPAASVDPRKALQELSALIAQTNGPDAKRSSRAIHDAETEMLESEPDKAEVASSIARAITYAKRTIDVGVYAAKLVPLAHQLAGWVGQSNYHVILDAIA